MLNGWQPYSTHPSKVMAPGAAAVGFGPSGWGLQGTQGGFVSAAMQSQTRSVWNLVLAHLHNQMDFAE